MTLHFPLEGKETSMTNADYDLRYLQAGIELLETYLFSNDVYWPVGIHAQAGEPPYPQLTIGNLMLALRRAKARCFEPEQKAQVSGLEDELNAIHDRWPENWEKKAADCFRARLNLWRDFVEEYRLSHEANADRYAYEVGRRVLLELLQFETSLIPEAEIDLLNGLDGLLKAVFIPGEFIWESNLQAAFPKELFWYLWGDISSI
jgi:hypothetical protein